jgi:hypothetical protein
MDIGDWITLAAVLVALGIGIASILHTRGLQRKERRERLLNEIIEWAIDSARPKYAQELTTLDYTLSIEDQTNIIQLSQSSYTHTLKIKGDYLSLIASSFTSGLSAAVENLTEELDKHTKLIEDWIDANVHAEDIGSHEYALTKAANAVLAEATKLKTQDIS